MNKNELRCAEAVLEAFMRHGEQTADLVGVFLKQFLGELNYRGPRAFPIGFLRELGAVLWLVRWQQSRVFPGAVDEFPSGAQLLHELVEQFLNEPQKFYSDPAADPTPLERQVIHYWMRTCSWAAQSNLGVPVLVKAHDRDVFLRELANYLWMHRNLPERGEETQ